MFLIVAFSVAIEFIIILIVYPIKKAIKRSLTYLTLILMLSGYICYIVKTGGYRSTFITFLLFSDSLIDRINKFPLSYYHLYALIQTTRILFPLLILSTALERYHAIGTTKSQARLRNILLAVPPIVIMCIFTRQVYTVTFADRLITQNILQLVMLLYTISYTLLSVFLCFSSIRNAYLSWYRKQNTYMLISIISLLAIYYIFALMDPLLLIQNYKSIKVGPLSYYINYKIDTTSLTIISLLMIISTTVNSIAMWKDAKIEIINANQEISITKSIKETGMFTRGLLHGLKNQMLVEKVLALELKDMIIQRHPQEEIVSCVDQLIGEQNTTYIHMENVHRTLKNIETHLVLDNSETILEKLEDECRIKYPAVDFTFCIQNGAILADRSLLKEALMNIIDNSVDAGANMISVVSTFTREHFIIEIADNGCGISKKMRKKIFLPFSTTKNMHTNWGFGLCFTRQVVKKHLGEIQFESIENIGTTFYVTLPRLY